VAGGHARGHTVQWLGKALGGAVGYWFGGTFGSVIGLLLGHQFDRGWAGNLLRDGLLSGGRRVQEAFFRTTFEVMGHLAKVDGRVSEKEIQVARRIMHGMRLSPEAVRAAIEHFTNGKSRDYPMRERLRELRAVSGGHADIARAFMEIQLQAAIGGGSIDPGKRRLLWEAAQALGIGRVELAQIEETLRARLGGSVGGVATMDIEAAYRILEVARDATDSQVKTAYRRLMNRHHPDKQVSRGLPESMIEVAKQKTLEIRAAYERIKTERGIR
jgi:DnaJ like chaperone protein